MTETEVFKRLAVEFEIETQVSTGWRDKDYKRRDERHKFATLEECLKYVETRWHAPVREDMILGFLIKPIYKVKEISRIS